MTTLTDNQLAQLAADAGWTGQDIDIAVAVALAESAGRTGAIGDVNLQTGTWGPSVGLWQIRSLNAQRGTGGVRDELANRDPHVNARHAHAVWRDARGWRPWSTWLHGTYRQFLDRAHRATGQVTDPGHPTPTGRVLSRYLRLAGTWLTGADVAACQRIVGCRPDGVFGPITHDHVQTWQGSHRLVVDGVVGPLTAAAFGWRWHG